MSRIQQPDQAGHRTTNRHQPAYQATAQGHGYDRSMGSNAIHGAGHGMASKGDDSVAQIMADELLRNGDDATYEAPEVDVERPDPGAGREWGVVRKWADDKGYGFIRPCNGDGDVFTHKSAVAGQGLTEGAEVTFARNLSARTGRQEASDVQGPGVYGDAPAKAGGAPQRGGYSGGVEKRKDPNDGNEYTKQEFRTFYGGFKEWDAAAAPQPAPGAADFPGLEGDASGTPAAAKPAPKWGGTGASGGMAEALRSGMAKQQALGLGVRTAAQTSRPPPGPEVSAEERAAEVQKQREELFPALPTSSKPKAPTSTKTTAASKLSQVLSSADQRQNQKPKLGGIVKMPGQAKGQATAEQPEGEGGDSEPEAGTVDKHNAAARQARTAEAMDAMFSGGGGGQQGKKKKGKGKTISLTGGGLR